MQKQFVKNGKSDRVKSVAMPATRNERVASAATLVLNNNKNNFSVAAPMTDTSQIQQTAVTLAAAPPSQRPSATSVSTGAFIVSNIPTISGCSG